MANSRLVDPADPTGNFKATLRLTRTVTPLGTSADSARIQAACLAMAGRGEVKLGPGTFLIDAPVTYPSNIIVNMHPSTVLIQFAVPL